MGGAYCIVKRMFLYKNHCVMALWKAGLGPRRRGAGDAKKNGMDDADEGAR